MKMKILILLSYSSVTLLIASESNIKFEYHDQAEKMTGREFKQHLKQKIDWFKNMSADEKNALIDTVSHKLEKAKLQLTDYIETLKPEQKDKLNQLRDLMHTTIEKIKTMTPEEKNHWKKNLEEKLRALEKNANMIKRQIGSLKNDIHVHKAFKKIEDTATWLKETSDSEREALKTYIHDKIEHTKRQLEHLKDSPKYKEFKRRIDALKESTKADLEVLKETITKLYKEMYDEL